MENVFRLTVDQVLLLLFFDGFGTTDAAARSKVREKRKKMGIEGCSAETADFGAI